MTFKFELSAGEFFELIRPTVLVLSALASIWVLASARRHRFPNYVVIGWALGTFLFPLITLPLYLIARFTRRSDRPANFGARKSSTSLPAPRWRVGIPLAYAAVVLSLIGFYLYWDQQSVDDHLARAAQAKVRGNRAGTIDEYRAALKLEDNPQREVVACEKTWRYCDWTRAWSNFQGGTGGEIDDRMALLYATCLIRSTSQKGTLEYKGSSNAR